MDVDDEMNKQLNVFADFFSYSQYNCKKTVERLLVDLVGCDPNVFGPCNSQNLTKFYGGNVDKDINYLNLRQDLQRRCHRECTTHSYDVIHNFYSPIHADLG